MDESAIFYNNSWIRYHLIILEINMVGKIFEFDY